MLAAAVGPNLTKLLHDQLDLMFACGLSEPLRQALVSIASHIPPLLKTIQGMPCCRSLFSTNLSLRVRPVVGLDFRHSLRPELQVIRFARVWASLDCHACCARRPSKPPDPSA